MPTVTIDRSVTIQDATEALQQQLGVVPTDVADTVHP